MRKGRPVLIEGRLQLDSWQGKDGQKRSKHRIFVERFQFIGGGQGGAQSGTGGYGQARQPARQEQPSMSGADDEPSPPESYNGAGGDDIPF